MFFFGFIIAQKYNYTPDDTYIYLQYAKNIAAGNGFSFNPGEQSYGVTSPLWVLILTIPYLIGISGLWFAKIVDLLSAILAMFIFFRLCGLFFKNDKLLKFVATGIFIMNVWFIRWAFTGMETSFAVLLVVYIFYLFYSGKYSLMFLISGLCYLTRPETALLSVILFCIIAYRTTLTKETSLLSSLRFIGLFLLPVLPFLIFAKFSFGTIMPNTALGKSTLTLNYSIIISQFIEITKTLAGASLIEMILTIFFLGISVFKKDLKNTLPILVWIVSLAVLYIVTDADIISRYLLLISPFLILTGLLGLEYLNRQRITVSITVFLAVLMFSQFIFYRFVKPSTDDFSYGVDNCFLPIGKWLNENTSQNSKVLVNDVGVIGYYAERYIIDAAALINSDLELNSKIMSAPLDDRLKTHKLLKFIEADYVIDRDTSESELTEQFQSYRLQLQYMRKFPSLGIGDTSPRYYKIYKVIKEN